MATKNEEAEKQKRAVLVSSNKGGPGKSWTTRTLGHLYRTASIPVDFYDSDGTGGAFATAYGTRENGKLIPNDEQNPRLGAKSYSISDPESARTLTDSFASDAEVVLHDMKGGSLESIMGIVDGGDGVDGFLDLADSQNRRLTLVHVVNDDKAATVSVGIYLDLFGDRVDHIAVVNQRLGKGEAKFPFWYGFARPDGVEQGGASRRQLGEMFGFAADKKTPKQEILLPGMDIGTTAKLNAYEFTFADAVDHQWFTITERAIVQNYVKGATAAFLPVRQLLGL